MSSRAIKKVLQNEGYDDLQANILRIEQLAAQKAANATDPELEPTKNKKKPASNNRGFSAFELLDGLEDDLSDNNSSAESDSISPPTTNDYIRSTTTSASKNKKAKAKAKKLKKNQALSQVTKSPESICLNAGPNQSIDSNLNPVSKNIENSEFSLLNEEIDGFNRVANVDSSKQNLSEIKIDSEDTSKIFIKSNSKDSDMLIKSELTRMLVGADIKSMNAEEEIKKMLGSDYGNVFKKKKIEKMYRMHPGLKRNRYIFAKPDLSWPPMKSGNGLTIDQIDLDSKEFKYIQKKASNNGDNGQWYNVFYTKRYKLAQINFYLSLKTHDPRNIQEIIYENPYHVDSLLQFALNMDSGGASLEEMSEHIDKALFALETAFGTGFNFTNANCRLDFQRAENRTVFVCLFRQVLLLSKKGCWRTALETAKALLGLDPIGDPMCAILLLDYIAIKAKKYSFIKDFYEKWPWSSTKLPNWMYSVATAEFLSERSKYKPTNDNKICTELHQKSLDLLVTAILAFPTAIPKLLTHSSIAINDNILSHPYFYANVNSNEESSTHLEILNSIFAERNSFLYRSREAAQWLNLGIEMSLEKYSKIYIPTGGKILGNSMYDESKIPETLLGVNLELDYNSFTVPYNVARHVIASDFAKIIANLPQELIKSHIYAFDPLPPKNNINNLAIFLEDNSLTESRIQTLVSAETLINELQNYIDTNGGDGEDDDEHGDFFGRIVRRLIPWLRRYPPDTRVADLGIYNSDSDDSGDNDHNNGPRDANNAQNPLIRLDDAQRNQILNQVGNNENENESNDTNEFRLYNVLGRLISTLIDNPEPEIDQAQNNEIPQESQQENIDGNQEELTENFSSINALQESEDSEDSESAYCDALEF
ncbi:hypothetical protein BB561_003702 [Smittium simulii]|uniref:Transcription factor 25 n=1 Tax=Smittium simulii TaxID=133385 RepID=A0A2T9YK03_9FUNG|nr:hypothetical protein BB561_003702 [Smittium simulii]